MPEGTPRAACWLRPDQAEAVARILAAAGILPAFAGSSRAGQTGHVARALNCEPCDDLRSAIVSLPVDLVFIADAGDFGHREVEQDLTALQAARARAVPVATVDPVPATATELSGSRWTEAMHNGSLAELVRVVPRTRRTPAVSELHAAIETFGVPRTCSVRMTGPATLASLGARLFDAMDLLRTLMGVPETTDACFVAPAQGRGLHQLPGESLRGLAGDMTVHLRYADGRAAVLHLSDQSFQSTFDLRVLGAEGSIAVTPDRFVWRRPDGGADDTPIATTAPDPAADPGENALIEQLGDLCAGVCPKLPPIDYPAVLSMAHAALLSCRTGQGEAPDTIRRIMQFA